MNQVYSVRLESICWFLQYMVYDDASSSTVRKSSSHGW